MRLMDKFGKNKSPLNPDLPFLGQTTHRHDYRPFKTSKHGDGKTKSKVPDPSLSYKGQWKSIHGKDYDGKDPLLCPAGELLKSLRSKILADGTLGNGSVKKSSK